MKLRLIEALQLPEVLDGSKWLALPVPTPGDSRVTTTDHGLPTMTIGVDPVRGTLHYCDRIYDSRAPAPTHLGSEAALTLPVLLGECAVVSARTGGTW